MEYIFLKLFNMSMSAGWLVLAVLLLRLLLRKAPKGLTCTLWAFVAVRLICPFSVKSPVSLIPSAEVLTPYNVQYAVQPQVDSGIPALDHAINPVISNAFAPDPGVSINPLHVYIFLASLVWAVGVFCLAVLALIRYWQIQKEMQEAILSEGPVWLCDWAASPFIIGIFRPRIYLPSDLTEVQTGYVLTHEQAHLARKDHWWKALGYVLLCIYWFHPLLWAAYALFCRDLELACDEKVIRNMDLQEKKAYSHALLSCSSKKRIMIICPLAFSEGKLKNRIKAVLHYKKPPFWIAAAAGIACAVTALCFLTDPVKAPASAESAPGDHISAFFHENEPIPADSEQPETPSPNTESSPDMSDPSEPADNIEDAITRAILTYHAFDQSVPYDLACCDFTVLETVHSALSKEASNPTVIFYGWALYQEYQILEDGIKETGGSHLPVELTFEQTDNGWELKEYWQPRDGSYFIEDIRSRFPAHIASDGIDSQKYILPQKQNCYRQAIENSSLEPAPVIRNLLKTVVSDPKFSSNPQDYIDANFLAYRELLYYGEYTIRYCFKRFEQGDEIGLEGRIMADVCEELLQTKGTIPADADTSPTGQFWYDTLRAHAFNRIEPYLSATQKTSKEP